MTSDRLFLDTVFVQARLNAADQYHLQANALAARVRTAAEIWTTEAVLTEIANALSAVNRQAAVQFIDHAFRTPNVHVVTVDHALFEAAMVIYRNRPDKHWGLTDCISFVVMSNHKITDALTADEHFVQAGFNTLLTP